MKIIWRITVGMIIGPVALNILIIFIYYIFQRSALNDGQAILVIIIPIIPGMLLGVCTMFLGSIKYRNSKRMLLISIIIFCIVILYYYYLSRFAVLSRNRNTNDLFRFMFYTIETSVPIFIAFNLLYFHFYNSYHKNISHVVVSPPISPPQTQPQKEPQSK